VRAFFRAIVDEARLVFLDAGVLIISVLAVIVYAFFYPLPYSTQVMKDVPIAVVDLDHSALSRRLARMADGHQSLKVGAEAISTREAEALVRDGAVAGVLVVARGFETDVLEGRQARVTGQIDAAYLLTYNTVLGGLMESVGTLSAGVEVTRLRASGRSRDAAMRARRPIGLDLQPLFNATSGYGTYVVPAVLVLILQQTLLIGTGMAGGARRERAASSSSRAAGPAFAAEPGHAALQVAGRAVPYLLLYSLNAAYYFVFVPRYYGYYVPGSLGAVALLTVPFLLATVFLGFTLRALFSRRETAMQVVLFTSLPLVFLAGFAWPIEALPAWLRAAAALVPSTSAIPAYLRLTRMGAGLADVARESAALWALAAMYFPAACLAEALPAWRARRR
jgi:ABC-2 type transport system permease protein